MNKNLLEILSKYYGYTSFRKGQESIINSILSEKDVLAIMPTGGKINMLSNSSFDFRWNDNSNFSTYITYERPSRCFKDYGN